MGWTPEVAPCPPEGRRDALAVLYRRVPASLRPRLIADALVEAERGLIDLSGLWVARRRGRVVGALLTQPLAGRAAGVLGARGRFRLAARARRPSPWCAPPSTTCRPAGFLLAQALLDESTPSQPRPTSPRGECRTSPTWSTSKPRPRGRFSVRLRPAADRLAAVQPGDRGRRSAPSCRRPTSAASTCPSSKGFARSTTSWPATAPGAGSWPTAGGSARSAASRTRRAVLLLSEVPDRDAWEVAYLGLTPQARGRGLGRAVLAHAAEPGPSLRLTAGAGRRRPQPPRQPPLPRRRPPPLRPPGGASGVVSVSAPNCFYISVREHTLRLDPGSPRRQDLGPGMVAGNDRPGLVFHLVPHLCQRGPRGLGTGCATRQRSFAPKCGQSGAIEEVGAATVSEHRVRLGDGLAPRLLGVLADRDDRGQGVDRPSHHARAELRALTIASLQRRNARNSDPQTTSTTTTATATNTRPERPPSSRSGRVRSIRLHPPATLGLPRKSAHVVSHLPSRRMTAGPFDAFPSTATIAPARIFDRSAFPPRRRVHAAEHATSEDSSGRRGPDPARPWRQAGICGGPPMDAQVKLPRSWTTTVTASSQASGLAQPRESLVHP